ncbi:KTSC domain-containing protein [Rubrolithibacter danxiaensis]|uniref:KTSC domain-containing protein n=1 Tax=Rubrolithibacter danxiaensis TaxID=3390805 RepID=UPI003BF917A3
MKRLSEENAIYTPGSGTTVMINYSFKKRILEVEFTGGKTYHYLNVEPDVWKSYKSEVESGESSGQFVNFRIKPFYEFVLINP